MQLAAPPERTLLTGCICSAEAQQGMNGGMEEKTRTFLTLALGATQEANEVEEQWRGLFSFFKKFASHNSYAVIANYIVISD